MRKAPTCLTLAVLSLCLPSKVCAMGEEHFGDDALNEMNYRDWQGIVPLVNHPSRVYHWWVNGNEEFYYRGDTKKLSQKLKTMLTAIPQERAGQLNEAQVVA
jgi:hypothetical protein